MAGDDDHLRLGIGGLEFGKKLFRRGIGKPAVQKNDLHLSQPRIRNSLASCADGLNSMLIKFENVLQVMPRVIVIFDDQNPQWGIIHG
jgi:hypothetical protein